MGGIHKISSSIVDGISGFVQSGSRAKFKSGISSSNLSTAGAIFARNFKNLNTGGGTAESTLLVGTQSADGSFSECVTFVNTDFRLSASGSFNHFTFIEKRIDGWFQISTGSQNGQTPKTFVDITGKPDPGIYEYFVLAASTSSLSTVVKGTTVNVKSLP